ncbi:hypothetical protein J6590_005277 [Homalodisca vitripennis]|nr:hypothetical protein J6590_005277 [Homalodisca vitripennis]
MSKGGNQRGRTNSLSLNRMITNLVENGVVEWVSHNNDKLGNEIINIDDIVEAVTIQEKESEDEDKVSEEGKGE